VTKKYNFALDKCAVKKYLSSFNNFLLIKHLLNGNRFLKYYYNIRAVNSNVSPNIKSKEPLELTQYKRKLNIHMYSNERFYNKFGIDILQFLGKISSMSESSEEYKKFLSKINVSSTLGRKVILPKRKKILL
jgi:hypothetical protein